MSRPAVSLPGSWAERRLSDIKSVSLGALPSQFKPGKYCGLAEVCPGGRNEDLTVRPGPSFSSQASRAGPEAFFYPTYPGRTGQGETVAENSLPLVHLPCVNVAREQQRKASFRHQAPGCPAALAAQRLQPEHQWPQEKTASSPINPSPLRHGRDSSWFICK